MVARVVTSEKYFGIQPTGASLMMLGGITFVFMLYFLIRQEMLSVLTKSGGILLIIGMLGYMLFSLKQGGVEISPATVGFRDFTRNTLGKRNHFFLFSLSLGSRGG